ncbi:hydrophobin [Butyriboletus roseoflavus]|nr:hydrophobin [Butyriboletus roseoflavus]
MYMRFSALVPVAALAAVAAAAPNALEARTGGSSSCDTGTIQCCNQTYTQGSSQLTALLGLLGITIPNVAGLVGYQCNPIVGTNTCTQQPVCCTGNTYNGLIIVGCSPITIGA